MTAGALHVLMVEDSPDDAELLLRELAQAGYEVTHRRVTNAADMRSALEQGPWDVVLCDYALPGFGAPAALALMQSLDMDLPFIIVSGAVAEDVAIAALKAGAHDFISKGAYARLVPSIERERREAEVRRDNRRVSQALRKSEAYYRALIENASDLIAIVRRDGTIQYTSPAYQSALGYPAGSLAGTEFGARVHRDDAEHLRTVMDTARAAPQEAQRVHYRYQDHAGVWHPVESLITDLLDDINVRAIVVNTRDMLEQERLEGLLRQAQKMEAIGQLAGGVAHDFNNILTVIRTAADFLLNDIEPSDPRRDDASTVATAADRAAALTRQLLAFSRRQVLQPQVVDVNVVVTNLEKMLRRLISEDITFSIGTDRAPAFVYVDSGQLEQVIMNLVVNSRDAMPHGGRLCLSVAHSSLREPLETTQGPVPAGTYVVLTVADEGVGMPPDVLERIFEPFFTTKQAGSGLGLATVYGIVQQSGGHVVAQSVVGRGTSIQVYLPVAPGKGRKPAPPPAVAVARGDEVILVVEDELPVRTLTRRSLERFGYRVLEAGSGEEALTITAREPVIHLLLTDVVMPGMSGPQLATRLAATRPDIPVLYMSGYLTDELVARGMLATDIAILPKPFTLEALARKVREALETRQLPAAALPSPAP